ncbi:MULTISPECIES: shikimate dehydrogenase [Aerococcus]|uniref:Shikimate dehydrogenase (NADP(+)) n=2 Tax=Aerococcus TaxID=1375 RepID=A0A0X8FH53_9LACT|nr:MULTISPECIES: shikimate dehydrogenase [Aerococcus]AMB96457.1 quinate/shikimate dehydrogenase [Aerococcus urinae]MCY3025261.1 shikimate dehydrogenase [Aerococcus loyolae]MCY3027050.1 shikimate dehydrogenase [Aerococcus loyolae]MCY3028633.1 shikimate dehydrogenase [Aerococcus loyolae]MCY3032170.1 shikimate dehydrogenase [Aerococcus urinae]
MTERLDGHTLLVSLLATPIRHSKSPTMHNEAFAKLNLPYAYLAFEVGNDELADAIQGIRALGIRGSNISMPNKQKVIPLLDELDESAELIGAVNTVTNKDGKGHLVGYNTDGVGAMKALAEEGVEVKGATVTLVGCGGAGTAIAVQGALDGIKELHIFNQDDEFYPNAVSVAERINQRTDCKATVEYLENREALKEAMDKSSIYIDASGVGMHPLENESVITDPSFLREDLVVFDTVYSPAETELLKFAKEHGVKKAINGLGMMLYQGAVAFKHFCGEDMPVEYIHDLLFKDN